MKKDEILKRSRSEQSDERKEHIDDKAFVYGMVAVMFVSFILIAWNDFHDQPFWDISAIVCSALGVGSLVKYKDSKKIAYLIVGLVATILTITSISIYFMAGI